MRDAVSFVAFGTKLTSRSCSSAGLYFGMSGLVLT